jgi:hypothetical protein
MSEREQFEAAIKALAELPEDSHETPYPDEDANTYWAIWQASRRSALEEAARIWDNDGTVPNLAGQAIARAIRALATETNNG